jgi:DNA polymerase I-like protein with 3'-5' exonuclease and polymerase domains
MLSRFEEVWCLDFEFQAPAGENPSVVCMVAQEVNSGRRLRLWRDELPPAPPFRTDDKAVFIAFYASAEMGSFLSLGWPLPAFVIDLFAEFRGLTNGKRLTGGNSLLGVLAAFHLPHMPALEKKHLRDLVMRGGPWSQEEQAAILDYCGVDVDALLALLPKMTAHFEATPTALARALHRGRYTKAVAHMERNGIPVDTALLGDLLARWRNLQLSLVEEVDREYGVHEGCAFKFAKFEALIQRLGVAWPRTDRSLRLATDHDTFKAMALRYPYFRNLHELRGTLGQMRLADIAVGADGRTRTLLNPFGTKTGRNAPSSSKFIFGPATWMRSLIKPGPGKAVAYIDWSAQEIAIGAVLSGDARLREAVISGDPYLQFARLVGLAPADATKVTHRQVRDLCKIVFLGVSYGMGEYTLAMHIGCPTVEARHMLLLHREAFPVFSTWLEEQADRTALDRMAMTRLGWPLFVEEWTKPTTLRNFPIQATGAEILRLACCLATEAGVKVCAPVHDALLIEDDSDRIEKTVRRTIRCMDNASKAILDGLVVKTDTVIVRYPHRYHDDRGKALFETITGLLRKQMGIVVN